jgi:hypothetical protein
MTVKKIQCARRPRPGRTLTASSTAAHKAPYDFDAVDHGGFPDDSALVEGHGDAKKIRGGASGCRQHTSGADFPKQNGPLSRRGGSPSKEPVREADRQTPTAMDTLLHVDLVGWRSNGRSFDGATMSVADAMMMSWNCWLSQIVTGLMFRRQGDRPPRAAA